MFRFICDAALYREKDEEKACSNGSKLLTRSPISHLHTGLDAKGTVPSPRVSLLAFNSRIRKNASPLCVKYGVIRCGTLRSCTCGTERYGTINNVPFSNFLQSASHKHLPETLVKNDPKQRFVWPQFQPITTLATPVQSVLVLAPEPTNLPNCMDDFITGPCKSKHGLPCPSNISYLINHPVQYILPYHTTPVPYVTYRMGQRSFPLDSTFFFFLRDKQSCKGQRVTHLGSHLNGLPFFLHCVVNAITPCVTHFQSIHFRIPSLLYKFMSASRTLLPNFCVHALVLPKNNEPWLVVVCVSGIK